MRSCLNSVIFIREGVGVGMHPQLTPLDTQYYTDYMTAVKAS